MARTLTKEEISELPVATRLELLETIWDSISPADVPVPESHKRLLDLALEDFAQNPDEGATWEEVREELFRRR